MANIAKYYSVRKGSSLSVYLLPRLFESARPGLVADLSLDRNILKEIVAKKL